MTVKLDEWIADVLYVSEEVAGYPDEVTYEVALACFGVEGLLRLTEAVSEAKASA